MKLIRGGVIAAVRIQIPGRDACLAGRPMRMTFLSVVLVWASLAVHNALADRIYLTNGRHLDGIVVAEGKQSVTLRVEGGEMRVACRRIKEIRYSSPAHARAIEEAWKQKGFLRKDYVPPGLQDIGKRMRALRDRRQTAVTALRGLKSAASRARRLRQERDARQADMVAAGQRLRAMNPASNVREYNRCVARMNELQGRVTSKWEALHALPELKRGWRDLIGDYRDALQELHRDVVTRHGRGGALTGEDRTFLNRVLIETGRLVKEFHTSEAPLDIDRYGHTVLVRINGQVPGRFVVDTGASVMTLSKSFAETIGVTWDKTQSAVEMGLANGARVTGYGVMLDDVAVGEVSSTGVRAVVLEKPPAERVDGLLGMSFLGRFAVKIEPGSDQLNITEFEPEE